MFGSREQPELMGARNSQRRIVLHMPELMAATEALQQLSEFMAAYEGDRSALLFGFWDYGNEIVITAPDEAQYPVKCSQCGKPFASILKLAQHVQKTHGSRK